MTAKDISFIIPIFNRPEEAKELLESFYNLDGDKDFEIVIVEDGSTETSEFVVNDYLSKLHISYYFKENSGPGDSRNYGMKRAKGNYFIILDSDCVLPRNYLKSVLNSLNKNYVDCFGGPDAAHESFSNIQKAINFAMTSFITTGGIRGKTSSINKFQPRSFNMGISKVAFLATGGFGRIHPGEDPDLSIRLWKLDYKTTLIPEAFVYHKRRISWSKFYKQVYKFGSVRPILNKWHPDTKKITYWFPSLFCLGLIISLVAFFYGVKFPIYIVLVYFSISFILAIITTKNIVVAVQSLLAILIQFIGYGYGFLKSNVKLWSTKKNAEVLFPTFFFKAQK